MPKPKLPIISTTAYRLRFSRISKNLSQAALAKDVGLSVQTIKRYENGKTGIPLKTLKVFADYLGVTTDYLEGKTDSMTMAQYVIETLDDDNERSRQHFKNAEYEAYNLAWFFKRCCGCVLEYNIDTYETYAKRTKGKTPPPIPGQAISSPITLSKNVDMDNGDSQEIRVTITREEFDSILLKFRNIVDDAISRKTEDKRISIRIRKAGLLNTLPATSKQGGIK